VLVLPMPLLTDWSAVCGHLALAALQSSVIFLAHATFPTHLF
jgi:hypothetical protein